MLTAAAAAAATAGTSQVDLVLLIVGLGLILLSGALVITNNVRAVAAVGVAGCLVMMTMLVRHLLLA